MTTHTRAELTRAAPRRTLRPGTLTSYHSTSPAPYPAPCTPHSRFLNPGVALA
jgi:hypothetical protein